MRWALKGGATHYPEWAICLDMAHGDPLRAKEIFEQIDETWFQRWMVWKQETRRAKIPDYIVGMFGKDE